MSNLEAHHPLYVKIRNSTRIKQRKPQPQSTVSIKIDELASHQEKFLEPSEGKIEEVTSHKGKGKQPLKPMRIPTIRETMAKQLKAQAGLL